MNSEDCFVLIFVGNPALEAINGSLALSRLANLVCWGRVNWNVACEVRIRINYDCRVI